MEYKQKRQIVESLLDHWEDFFSVASSGLIVAEEPDPAKVVDPKNWTLFSSMSKHPSVVEIKRVLEVLAAKMPKHYAVVVGFYGAPRKIGLMPKVVKGRTVMKPDPVRPGRLIPDTVPTRARIVPAWIGDPKHRCREHDCPCGGEMARMLCRSLDILLGLWSSKVKLELPKPLEGRLREMTDEDGTHLTEAA